MKLPKTQSPRAKLRCCAACEWVFKQQSPDKGCPKCHFAHYGAHFVYGPKAYRFAKTQQPWREKKLSQFIADLDKEIRQNTMT